MRTSNPALNSETFTFTGFADKSERMTIGGAVNKTLILTILVFISAYWTWTNFSAMLPNTYIWLLGGAIGGFIIAMVTISRKTWSPFTTPIYAVLEGITLGGISFIFESDYPGIVIQAIVLTFGTLFSLLIAYKSGLIKPTENFKLGVVAATGGIAIIYLVDLALRFFGKSVPIINESSTGGIIFSIFVVILAALNLVLDFDFIETGAAMGAPKYMEWYAAFGLLVTLIWLYLEILKLLAKMRRRR